MDSSIKREGEVMEAKNKGILEISYEGILSYVAILIGAVVLLGLGRMSYLFINEGLSGLAEFFSSPVIYRSIILMTIALVPVVFYFKDIIFKNEVK